MYQALHGCSVSVSTE